MRERYKPFAFLTDEELQNAIEQIERAELSFVTSSGQQTLSIGAVSFSYATRSDLNRIKASLIDAYNQRTTPAISGYKITHLMR